MSNAGIICPRCNEQQDTDSYPWPGDDADELTCQHCGKPFWCRADIEYVCFFNDDEPGGGE
jgi:hypothetical protein